MIMAAFGSRRSACALVVLVFGLCVVVGGARVDDGLEVTWGDDRGSVSPDGQVLSLSLDRTSSSGFRSRNTYLFARVDVQIKLVANNSAGTVTTCYVIKPAAHAGVVLSAIVGTFFWLGLVELTVDFLFLFLQLISEGEWDVHDEVDLEFLGNVTGEPYTLHTNVFANGTGGKEQQFHLWFDPTADFHTYSIVWTSRHILVLVDGTPIREIKNNADKGVAYPASQQMRLYGTLWNADDWATQGGRVKTDWSQAPFVAQYRNFTALDTTSAATPAVAGGGTGYVQEIDATAQQAMKWARDNYMVYDYCADTKRFPLAFPLECAMP
ncbi:hypothetical protein GUJ93_ZPchr0004g38285 [Zizania palustris]|uniref:Xyloglucan endotransglucosylase/hydrolase n=1 Tax=Zizania palustris TaxID=103762 RepID=A0A8J5T1V7_ZIZPA|nr:hypothetical protein GUJ93_ZPchr0004g38285 [Zizania palustris]